MLVNGKTAIDAAATLASDLAALDRAAVGAVALGCHFQTRIGRSIFLTLISPPSWKRTSIRLPTLSLTIDETQISTRLGERLQARGNIDAITINVVAFNNNVAKIDTDSQHDGTLRCALVRRPGAGTLHRKCTAHGVDHTTKLGDDAIANELHNAAIMGGDCRVENGFPVPFQRGQRARLVGSH